MANPRIITSVCGRPGRKSTMLARTVLLQLLAVLLVGRPLADSFIQPKAFLAVSHYGHTAVKVVPVFKRGDVVGMTGTAFDVDAKTGKEERLWRHTLLGIPTRAFVSFNGVVIAVNPRVGYPQFGKAHALTIYARDGHVLSDYELDDLLTTAEIDKHIYQTVSARWWAMTAAFGFNDDETRFSIKLGWDKEIVVDVQTGRIIPSGQPAP